MEETCTFSRALHLMRYGGKKMRYYLDTSSIYFFVKNDKLFMRTKEGSFEVSNLLSDAIMGSWVEVRD